MRPSAEVVLPIMRLVSAKDTYEHEVPVNTRLPSEQLWPIVLPTTHPQIGGSYGVSAGVHSF
jgi:hypothetical protein